MFALQVETIKTNQDEVSMYPPGPACPDNVRNRYFYGYNSRLILDL
jgi:hypothetical protein